MCEVLIVAEDRLVPESSGKWRKGDPVIAMPDGHEWGAKEGLPLFVVVSVDCEPADLDDIMEMDVRASVTRGRRVLPLNENRVDVARDAMVGGTFLSMRENQFRAQLNSRDYP